MIILALCVVLEIAAATTAQKALDTHSSQPFQPLSGRILWIPPAKDEPPALQAGQRITVRYVDIGPEKFSVTLDGQDSVTVTGGDSSTAITMALSRRFSDAAFKATGCLMHDGYWNDRTLMGKLDCSSRLIR